MKKSNIYWREMKLKKQKRGEYLSYFAPFGYFVKSEPYRHLEIDNVSATVIRLIFNELVSGKTINYVSDFLNTMRFSTPKEYKDTASIISEDNDLKSLWTEKMILNIARNIIYIVVTPSWQT